MHYGRTEAPGSAADHYRRSSGLAGLRAWFCASASIVVPIVVAIAIVVSMVVAPCPIFFLVSRRQLAEIAVGIATGLVGPLAIVVALVTIPLVIVGVIRVVHPVSMMASTR